MRITTSNANKNRAVAQPCTPEAADVVVLLEDGDVTVAEPGEEGGAADAGRTAAEQRDLGAVGGGQIGERRRAGVADLRNLHLHESLSAAN